MKPTRFRIRTLLIAIALAALIMAGVATVLRRPGRPYSTVFATLDPVALLGSKSGYQVRVGASWNVFNTSQGYAYKEWRGVVRAPGDPSLRQTIQSAIEAYIEKLSKGRCHTEGSLITGEPYQSPTDDDLPTHAVFMFNEDDRHGELHGWLFPDSSGSSVGFAFFLRDLPFQMP